MKRTITGLAASAALALSVLAGPPATAAPDPTWNECRHAQPRSSTADACRARGWDIRWQFAVSPRNVAVRVDVPECKGTESNCYVLADEVTGGPAIRYRQWGLRLIRYVDSIRPS